MNDERNVREKTRDKVHKSIAELGYTPNTAARSLAAGEATHIGLIYSNPSAAYLSQFLVGALEGARAAGCHLVIEACESDEDADRLTVARHIATGPVEGVILPPPLSEAEPILKELAASGTSVVTVAMGEKHPNPLNVRIDDRKAACELTDYLLKLGHRRIGFIKGNPDHIATVERERGYRAALAEAGISVDETLIAQGYFTFRSGLEAAEQLLDLPQPPTAIFACNDDMAAAVIGVAHRRSLDVPGDLSVVGFDDTYLATAVWPELTTVRQPVSAMARSALELLLADLRQRRSGEPSTPEERILDYELIVRESAAPPRA